MKRILSIASLLFLLAGLALTGQAYAQEEEEEEEPPTEQPDQAPLQARRPHQVAQAPLQARRPPEQPDEGDEPEEEPEQPDEGDEPEEEPEQPDEGDESDGEPGEPEPEEPEGDSGMDDGMAPVGGPRTGIGGTAEADGNGATVPLAVVFVAVMTLGGAAVGLRRGR